MNEARINVEYPHGICVNWQISWMIMNWNVILILYSYLEWFIRLSDPPLSLWVFSPQLSLALGDPIACVYVGGALLYVLTGEFENADAPEISRIFAMLSYGRRGRGLAVNHPQPPVQPLKWAGPRLREMKFLDCLLGKSIKTDSRSYLSLVVY